MNQLIQVDYSDETVKFTYDKVGNRKTMITANGTINYEYNANNQLTKAGNMSYTYYKNGNLKSPTDTKGAMEYKYNHENRLITYHSSLTTTHYSYDSCGIKISKEVDSSLIKFIYDGEDEVTELQHSQRSRRVYRDLFISCAISLSSLR